MFNHHILVVMVDICWFECPASISLFSGKNNCIFLWETPYPIELWNWLSIRETSPISSSSWSWDPSLSNQIVSVEFESGAGHKGQKCWSPLTPPTTERKCLWGLGTQSTPWAVLYQCLPRPGSSTFPSIFPMFFFVASHGHSQFLLFVT